MQEQLYSCHFNSFIIKQQKKKIYQKTEKKEKNEMNIKIKENKKRKTKEIDKKEGKSMKK